MENKYLGYTTEEHKEATKDTKKTLWNSVIPFVKLCVTTPQKHINLNPK